MLCTVSTLALCLCGTAFSAFAEESVQSTANAVKPLDLIDVSDGAAQPSRAEIEAYDPLKFYVDGAWEDEATVSPTTYQGIRIPLSDSAALKAEYRVKDVFTKSFSVKYVFGSAGENTSDVYFDFKDAEGNSLRTAFPQRCIWWRLRRKWDEK